MSKGRGKDNELRAAMMALKVNSPLKLPKSGLGMRPPSEPPRKEVPLAEGPPLKEPHPESPQVREPNASEPVASRDRNSKDDARHLKNRFPQNEWSHSEVPKAEHTRLQVPPNENALSEIAESEVPAKHRQPRNEQPQIDNEGLRTDTKPNQGFFKLSHSTFSEPLLQELSGDGFRLFLWLSSRAWRYAKSEGVVRASVRYIEEQTGMSHATVSRALKTLKERNLIRLVEMDFKRGNVWQVSSIAFGNRDPEPPRSGLPQDEGSEKDVATTSKRGGGGLISSTKLPQNERNIRSIKNQKNLTKEQATGLSEKNEIDLALREQAIDHFEETLEQDIKKQVIEEFISREFPHGYLPPIAVIRNMAALHWYGQVRNSHSNKIAS